MVEEKTEKFTDWYDLWMKQSQAFYDTANSNLKQFFEQGAAFKPEEHRDMINDWLDNLKKQWQSVALTEEQKAYANYWTNMAKMFNDASKKMMEEWIESSRSTKPIKSIQELHQLWLKCCQEAYAKSLNSQYQAAYNDFVNQAFDFWKKFTPTGK